MEQERFVFVAAEPFAQMSTRYRPPKARGFAVSAVLTVACGVAFFGLGAYYLQPKPTPKTVVVEKEVVKVLRVPVPAMPKPEPEPPPPPPEPEPQKIEALPPEPPRGWAGIWRSADGKSAIRLIQKDKEVAGFYVSKNSAAAAAVIAVEKVTPDKLTFKVQVGDRLYGFHLEMTDVDAVSVWRWVDPDGLLRESQTWTDAARRGRVNAPTLLQERYKLQQAMKTAGKRELIGTYTRQEDS
jgi:hypothetical protein